MGYSVNIELEGVKFKKSNSKEVVKILKELNKTWMETSDWCRFSMGLNDVMEIIEDIGFSVSEADGYIIIEEFDRENLGDHQNMFASLAKYLENCKISYSGEDGNNWDQRIINGKLVDDSKLEDTVTVEMSLDIKIPSVPNFVKACNKSIPIEDLSDEQLERLGEAWVKKLIAKAQSRRES